MNGKPFFDSNLLVYSVVAKDTRADVAASLLASGGIVSVQVLNEFVSVVRRKLKMPWPDVRRALAAFQVLLDPPVPVTVETHRSALDISERYGYGIYEALIIATAIRSKCKILYSEDMHCGQDLQGVTIRNPF